jgi:hypothetical protein
MIENISVQSQRTNIGDKIKKYVQDIFKIIGDNQITLFRN